MGFEQRPTKVEKRRQIEHREGDTVLKGHKECGGESGRKLQRLSLGSAAANDQLHKERLRRCRSYWHRAEEKYAPSLWIMDRYSPPTGKQPRPYR